MADLPPLRYLTGADVVAAMPPLAERLRWPSVVLRGLAEGAELPPKIGVHPRPDGVVRPRDAGATCRARPTTARPTSWA